jgi:replication factor C subunit 1
MFTDKYKPQIVENIVGNKQSILSIQNWFEKWCTENKNTNQDTKQISKTKENKTKTICALLSGPSGIGKTLTVELFIKKYDLNPITLSPDDKIDKEYILKTIIPSLQNKKSYSKKNNIFVIHDIDCYDDYGFISSIVNCFKETKIPVIATCNNRYEQALKPIIPYCLDVKYQKLSMNDIVQFLKHVIKTEKININDIRLKQLIEDFDYDLRSVLNNLQLYNATAISKVNAKSNNTVENDSNIGKDKSNSNIFEVTKLFMSQNIEITEKQTLYWLNNDIIPLMIHENYPINNIKMKNDAIYLNNISTSIASLSDLDIFEKEIHTNGTWELLPYTAWLSIKAVENCHAKVQIKFTSFFEKRVSKKPTMNTNDLNSKLTNKSSNILTSNNTEKNAKKSSGSKPENIVKTVKTENTEKTKKSSPKTKLTTKNTKPKIAKVKDEPETIQEVPKKTKPKTSKTKVKLIIEE